ncbi:MAG: signal peptidase I, partial [Cyanobacteria bacterium J06642_11]
VIFYSSESAILQDHLEDVFIKRVMGLPGETLEVKDGQLLVNSQAVSEDYIREPMKYQWGPETLPKDQYFLLGDNRNNSFDSHNFGWLPRNNIVGRATQIWWPLKRSNALR